MIRDVHSHGWTAGGTKGTHYSVTSSKTISKRKRDQRAARMVHNYVKRMTRGEGRRRTDEIIKTEQRSGELAIVLHDDPDS